MGSLQQRVALITGAGSGLGKAIAERFAAEGANVVVADIQQENGRAVAEAIDGYFIHVDVSDPASVEAMMLETVKTYGRLDILVNNAGIESGQAPVAESSIDDWQRVIAINLNGVYYGMKYGIATMRQNGGGAILNIASIAGISAMPNIAAYSTSKAGVIHLTRTTAMEYAAQNLRINALCPTVVMTPLVEHFIATSADPAMTRLGMENLNPMPGMVEASDVATAALFLCSDDSRYMTGVILPLDGGYTAR